MSKNAKPSTAAEVAEALCAVDFWTPEHVRQILITWEQEIRTNERHLAAELVQARVQGMAA